VNADSRVHDSNRTAAPSTVPAPPVLGPGASVVLLRPREVRGTIGVVRRRVTGGWEVEIRSPEGVPLHLTLPERALHLRG
jgi:hypothetical protein